MATGILLIGGGGHCRSVIDVLERAAIPIAGVVHGPDCQMEPVSGYPALGRDQDVAALRREFSEALVTVGQVKSPAVRIRLYSLFKEHDFSFRSLVSPLAYVSTHATIGVGSITMHNALINAGAAVGKNCIINTRALVEHDCVIADHCHIAVGAVLCGGVRVGEGSFIGAGAIIHPMVSIGAGCVIGMGARVYKDLPDGTHVRDGNVNVLTTVSGTGHGADVDYR